MGRLQDTYRIGKEIGRGQYGEVRLGQHRETGEKVAIKIIQTHDKKGLEKIKHEVRVLQKLNHPNICKFIACYDDSIPLFQRPLYWLRACFGCAGQSESPRRLYIVMQLATGGELFDRIVQKSFFNESEARDATKTILNALSYLHQHGIAHRDLKPENIIYLNERDDSPLQIVDFGASQLFEHDSPTNLQTMVGTPLYISPEVLQTAGGKRKHYGPEVDMWATGVIVYVMLSGILPFQDEHPQLMYKQILTGDYGFPSPYWDDVSEDAIDFVRGCLTPDPTLRLTPTDALDHNWITRRADFSNLDTDHLRYYMACQRFQHVTRVIAALHHFRKLSAQPEGPGYAPLTDDEIKVAVARGKGRRSSSAGLPELFKRPPQPAKTTSRERITMVHGHNERSL